MGFFQKLFGKKYDLLCAPVAGNAVPVTQVPDPTFAEEMLGKEHVLMKQFPSLGGEDFSYFIDGSKRGGAFYHLGCGNTAKGITAALHNQQFDVDEDCIPLGIQLQMTFLMDLLQK